MNSTIGPNSYKIIRCFFFESQIVLQSKLLLSPIYSVDKHHMYDEIYYLYQTANFFATIRVENNTNCTLM